jgi:hypothetical protein
MFLRGLYDVIKVKTKKRVKIPLSLQVKNVITLLKRKNNRLNLFYL